MGKRVIQLATVSRTRKPEAEKGRHRKEADHLQ